jgi:hypothetical protein
MSGDQVKEGEMGGTYSTHGGDEKYIQNQVCRNEKLNPLATLENSLSHK